MKLLRLLFLTIIIDQLSIINTNAQWSTGGPYGAYINCLAVSGADIYSGTAGNGVFLSTNNGAHWTPLNNGITGNVNVYTLAVNGNSVFSGTGYTGNFFSADNGGHWVQDTSLAYPAITSVFIGPDILIGTNLGPYLSADSSKTWTHAITGMKPQPVYSFALQGARIYAGTLDTIFVSTDNAASWSPIGTGLPLNYSGTYLAADDSTIFAGTYNGIYVSRDSGSTWSASGTGLPVFTTVTSITINGPDVFACTGDGVYLSTNHGATWNLTRLNSVEAYQVVVSSTDIFVATYERGVYLSADNATTFTQINNGLENVNVISLAAFPAGIFAGTDQIGIDISTNNGNNWTTELTGFADSPSVFASPLVYSFAGLGSGIFAGTSQGVYLSADNGITWVLTDTGFNNVTGILTFGNRLIANAGGGVYISDNGSTWTPVDSGFPYGTDITSIGISGTDIYAGTFSGTYLSTDTGTTWVAVNAGLPNSDVIRFASIGNIIFAAFPQSGVYGSGNNGNFWAPRNNGLTDSVIVSLISYGTRLFAGTGNGGVFESTDSGANWTSLGLTGTQVNALTTGNGYLYAGVNNVGVYQMAMPGVTCNIAAPVITAAVDTICPGDSTEICAPGGFRSYLWNNTDSAACTYVSQAGPYYVTVTDMNGCTAVSDTVKIAEYQVVQASIMAFGDTLRANPANGIAYQWYYFDTVIPGATTSSYVLGGCGNFMVQITDSDGCTSRAMLFLVGSGLGGPCGGFGELDVNTFVNIYPNPSSGSWQLEVSGDLLGSAAEIYDDEGRLVFNSKPETQNSKLELNIPAGVYYLRISNAAGSVVRKLVKM